MKHIKAHRKRKKANGSKKDVIAPVRRIPYFRTESEAIGWIIKYLTPEEKKMICKFDPMDLNDREVLVEYLAGLLSCRCDFCQDLIFAAVWPIIQKMALTIKKR
jgi:hypothetical protein